MFGVLWLVVGGLCVAIFSHVVERLRCAMVCSGLRCGLGLRWFDVVLCIALRLMCFAFAVRCADGVCYRCLPYLMCVVVTCFALRCNLFSVSVVWAFS